MKKYLILLILFYSVSVQLANVKIDQGLPKVYIDCRWCDLNFIREKVTFINVVRDRMDSDIQIYVNRLRTGSGGREFNMIFVGRKKFEGINDTLKYYTNQTDTEKSERMKMVKTLKLGLLRYLYKTPIANNFRINFSGMDNSQKKLADDPWDYWVFRTNLRTFVNGEQTSTFTNLRGSFSVSRVTEEWKINFYLSSDYQESNFDYDNTTIKNIKRSHNFYSSLVKSLSDHWSLGFWFTARSSTYRNIDFSVSTAPGIEYNIFPYSQVNVRQLKFDYRVWYTWNNYSNMTIYFKDNESLLQQRLSASFDLLKDWGNIGVELAYKNYFHDFSKNSFSVQGDLELQLIKGLSLNLFGEFEAVHDQISLPYSDASLEEVLLQRRELETQYTYHASIGFTYTFGSIYNNIVNTRFN